MTFEPIFGTKDTLKIIQLLIEGKTPKEIAFTFKCAPDTIYNIRKEYLHRRWVLKRHPKDRFRLES